MKIETYTYDLIDSKMYIIIESGQALVIDPCISDEAIAFLKKEIVADIQIILTHEHYDHISGIKMFRETFENCIVICSEKCNENMQSPIRNGSKYFKALFLDKSQAALEEASRITPVSYTGDILFNEKMEMTWQGHQIMLKETPGHSEGSICILIDNKYLFTGDSLIKDTPVITRLPGGSKKDYEKVTTSFLSSFHEDIYVYPGHGEKGEMREFLPFNELHGISQDEVH